MNTCKIIPSAYCKCESPPVYICNIHYPDHQRSKSTDHSLVVFLKTITLNSFQSFSSKISDFLTKLQEIISKLTETTSSVILKIQSDANSQLKKLKTLEKDLKFFITFTLSTQAEESVKIDTEFQESVEKMMAGKDLNYEKILKKTFKSLESLFNIEDKRKLRRFQVMSEKELCIECKIDYYIKCGFHLFCETCKICYCQKCLESTNYPIDENKREKLQIEQSPVIFFSDLNIQTSIHKGFSISSNQPVMISKLVSKNVKHLQYNYSILKFLNKKLPCFLMVYGNNLKGNEMMIVSELAIHPLRNLPGLNIQFHQIQKIAKELIEGFTFMSLYRIFHRNIGMDSILLNNELTPKIIDFGFAVLHSTDCNSNKISSITLAQGKDEFLAPERREFISKIKTGYKAETYNIEKSDVFSLGCVLFMLFTGFQYEIKSDSSEKDEWAKFYSSKIEKKEIRKLVYKMLNPNPKVRPFFKQVLEEYLMINFNDNSY
jgi:hypothetical protein